ncbi:trehalose-phosphatase [Falsirhodobacter sp. 20TX0035]|uniref:trehalose-phosphatase n=1 Tax=Falsirhodobacter sp. 20TX0035 TaxID=3022019 RepID=UPI00232F1B12|nr:trehalose-phosphatase [Falsirhodobacter sp. 20TX0035]MDB6452797.1 trehalose-phosphatase [Falsirhodobacter sp. 20TX0035]
MTDPLAPLLEDPGAFALFLDIDGCLIDLAPTPEGITVPDGLPDTLARLSDRLGGALALVTGRKLEWVDATFGRTFPLAGLHGFQRRRADGRVREVTVPPGLDRVRAQVAPFADIPGLVVEDKGLAIGLHYRQAPERMEEVKATMTAIAAGIGPEWELQFGKGVVELRPAGATKGGAVTAFLNEAPFAGRRPVTIGDDVTDETMFPVANNRGGLSIRIADPSEPTAARAHLPSPAALRASLERIAQWDA